MRQPHHDLSITGDKGGSRSVAYHNPNYQRGYKQTVKAGLHVMGVYATNAVGKALPLMYIFYSGAKLEQNFQVKTTWLEGLPIIKGRFGCPELIEESSFFPLDLKKTPWMTRSSLSTLIKSCCHCTPT